jgi:hypothetical protein
MKEWSMITRRIVILLLGSALWLLPSLGANIGLLAPVLAQGPSVDNACRNCHGETDREYTFPSGEKLTLQISLPALANSPHTTTAQQEFLCTDCHRSQTRYQYPHQPNPAQTQADFRSELEDNCQQCHYPHNPYHTDDQVENNSELPGCIDCHGSHDIGRVETLAETMTDNCLACHTAEERAWATDYLTFPKGYGQPAERLCGDSRLCRLS